MSCVTGDFYWPAFVLSAVVTFWLCWLWAGRRERLAAVRERRYLKHMVSECVRTSRQVGIAMYRDKLERLELRAARRGWNWEDGS